ncbi:MAG: prepilin-type N-terminal cleavage/methylation domain-containing protein [Sandaracinaceae bacterium]|nr:prepilin-type N-terminal cleavage/methylation domain-containing protein [Sandaracinaceae bacterium]
MITTRTSARARRRNAGFSLLELMVALTAGSIVVSAVYFVGGASARQFQEQQRIANLQTSVRLGMDQLVRDIERAGYLGSGNSRRDQVCTPPTTFVQAIEFENNIDDAKIPGAAANGVSADRLTLVGSYSSPDQFFATGLDAAGDTLTLQTTWQAFRRNFGVPTDTTAGNAFSLMFVPGRLLRIRTNAGNVFYVTITSASPASASIDFAPALNVGGPCVGGLMDGATVSVLTKIQYRAEDLAGFSSGSLTPSAAAATLGATPSFLIRQEMSFATPAVPIVNSERIVLEYLADFNLDFILDQQPVTTLPANLARFNGALANPLLQNVNVTAASTPERVRTVLVSLSARTPEQDPRFPAFARAAGDPLTRFRVNPALQGAARVRTLQTEVFTPNIR